MSPLTSAKRGKFGNIKVVHRPTRERVEKEPHKGGGGFRGKWFGNSVGLRPGSEGGLGCGRAGTG